MIDDLTIERVLGNPPPDEPTYIAGRVAWDSHGHPRVYRRLRLAPAWRRSAFVLVLALLMAVVLGLSLIIAGAVGRPDLLRAVDQAGGLRVAVRPDAPQALTTNLEGFDIDVAREVATRLGLAPAVVRVNAADMPDDGPAWDVGMPSDAVVASDGRLVAGPVYYRWPAYMVVRRDSDTTSITGWAGARICVTGGSAGAGWIAGRTLELITVVTPRPAEAKTVVRSTDQACLDALVAGQADAMVSARISLADLATKPSIKTLGEVLTESRTFVATRSGADPSALFGQIDAVLSVLRADGTLGDLSRSRFGGTDLTQLP
jgi:ABC-type amino acid transport substrate-binding protein